eukprot:Colp12_sorted_trinity150504_noHs@22095
MVLITIKKAEEPLFLYETTCPTPISEILKDLVTIENGRQKVERLCMAIETLAEHGIAKPPNMQGLTPDQIIDLKLVDENEDRITPQGGFRINEDVCGLRNGKAPNNNMAEMMKKTVAEARAMVSKNQVKANIQVNLPIIEEAMKLLSAAVTIVYPMGLPVYDPVRMIIDDKEELEGTPDAQKVLEIGTTQLWWASKELIPGKLLSDYIGKNEKTKIIGKIQKRGSGAPQREPIVDEETQKQMMAYWHKKQEELKKLETDDDDAYMGSAWADPNALKRQFLGTGDVSWRPRW